MIRQSNTLLSAESGVVSSVGLARGCTQIALICMACTGSDDTVEAAPNGGSARVLPDFLRHSA
jgi:hypothetical protein